MKVGSSLTQRVIKAGLRSVCRYRVIAIGYDYRGRIIGITTNTHRLKSRSTHAEERLIHRSPQSLKWIEIARVGARGDFLPIDPCRHCSKIAERRGIRIRRFKP